MHVQELGALCELTLNKVGTKIGIDQDYDKFREKKRRSLSSKAHPLQIAFTIFEE